MAHHSRALRLRRVALVAAERRLRDSEEQFRLAFETAPAGMAVVSLSPGAQGRILLVNDAFCAFTGRDRAVLLEARTADVLHPDDVLRHEAHLLRAVLHGEAEPSGVERRFVTPDGRLRWGRTATSLISPRDGLGTRLLVVVEDVTAEREAQRAMAHAALHDPLTGLGNRTLLGERLARATAPGGRAADRVTVLYVDLDGFKAVNDTHGHGTGDALLREVATLLRGAVREGDSVARLGGDEFVVVCPGLQGAPARALADRVERALTTAVVLPGDVLVDVAASVGVVTAAAGDDPLEVLDRADRAMYSSKARRRAGVGADRRTGQVPERPGGTGDPVGPVPLQALGAALEARALVEQATGYLAARLETSVAEGRSLLLEGAARRGVAVQELARQLVEGRAPASELVR